MGAFFVRGKYKITINLLHTLRNAAYISIELNCLEFNVLSCHLADLTVSKRPGTSNKIEIHFAVLITYIFAFPL